MGAVKVDMPHNITQSNQDLNSSIPNFAAKNEVAEIAASMVEDGDFIAIGSGSTAFLLASKLHGKRDLTVATNSVYVAYELMQDKTINFNICGGSILSRNGACNGPFAELYLNDIQVDKAFCGTDSVSLEKGFISMDADPRSERAQCLVGKQRYMLADASQFKNRPFIEKICNFKDVDAFITNSNLDDSLISSLRDRQVDLIMAVKSFD